MTSHRTTDPVSEQASRMRRAFAVAQQRAAQAVSGWAIDSGSATADRSDDIGAVYDAIVKGQADPSKTLHAGIGDTNRQLSDTVGELMAAAEDAGYLYGLAVGLALRNGGAQ